MFRTGGSAGTGITSGLAPRQGYSNGYRATKISDLGSRTIGELEDMARASTRPLLGTKPEVIPVPAEPPVLNIGLFNVLITMILY